MIWILLFLGVILFLYITFTIYLALVLRWEDEQTVGLGYYGLPAEERRRFKHRLRKHARLLYPLLQLNSRLARLDFHKSRIQYGGVSAPSGSCSVDSFAAGAAYQPRADDIFVVTQMKCGTTWMQQIVYEILMRGRGDLASTGTALYAVSPWLEGRKSVPVADAPLLGHEPPARIIKTHFPTQLCPFDRRARYIYVARHPVSCFASCIDFVVTNVGAMAPPMPGFEEWFCSDDLMWWGSWTNHVRGWWARAQEVDNVLFITFEDMKRDLPAVVRRVASFIGVDDLSGHDIAAIVHKAGFDYMRTNQDTFEMHPPHILQTNAALFVSGTSERHRDVPPDVRDRVLEWCARELADDSFPLAQLYPDAIATAAAGVARHTS